MDRGGGLEKGSLAGEVGGGGKGVLFFLRLGFVWVFLFVFVLLLDCFWCQLFVCFFCFCLFCLFVLECFGCFCVFLLCVFGLLLFCSLYCWSGLGVVLVLSLFH